MSSSVQAQIDDDILKHLLKGLTQTVSSIPISIQTRITEFVGFESDILLAKRLYSGLLGKGTFQGQTIKFEDTEYSLSWASESQMRIPPIQIQTNPSFSLDQVKMVYNKPQFMVYEEPVKMGTENPLVELRNALIRCHREGISIKQVDETYVLAVAQWVMDQ